MNTKKNVFYAVLFFGLYINIIHKKNKSNFQIVESGLIHRTKITGGYIFYIFQTFSKRKNVRSRIQAPEIKHIRIAKRATKRNQNVTLHDNNGLVGAHNQNARRCDLNVQSKVGAAVKTDSNDSKR